MGRVELGRFSENQGPGRKLKNVLFIVAIDDGIIPPGLHCLGKMGTGVLNITGKMGFRDPHNHREIGDDDCL